MDGYDPAKDVETIKKATKVRFSLACEGAMLMLFGSSQGMGVRSPPWGLPTQLTNFLADERIPHHRSPRLPHRRPDPAPRLRLQSSPRNAPLRPP